MGEIQIIEKLSKKFATEPLSEEDIVYALSKIRKTLEIHGHPQKFSVLNFYCNLALHSRIDRYPQAVEDMLVRAHKGENLSDSIINFTDFHRQIKEFAKEYGLPNWGDYYEINKFNKFLNSIYSDTPITLRRVDFEITVDNNGGINGRQVS